MANREMVAALSQRIRELEQASRQGCHELPTTTNRSELQRLFAEGNWPRGGVVEWLSPRGGGAVEAAFHSLSTTVLSRRPWCVVDLAGSFFGIKTRLGRTTRHCLVVQPKSAAEMWWAVEQILRCPGIGATWCWAEAVPDRVLRRWQLAAEAGGGIGMFFRPPEASRQSSWADWRLAVVPISSHPGQSCPSTRQRRTLRIDVVYCRGCIGGQSVVLELNHATGAMRVVSELANPAASSRRSETAPTTTRRVC